MWNVVNKIINILIYANLLTVLDIQLNERFRLVIWLLDLILLRLCLRLMQLNPDLSFASPLIISFLYKLLSFSLKHLEY